MPNGGPDNCSTCGFNRRNRGIWRNSAPDETQLSFCEIRGHNVLFDHFTYCQNWHTRTRKPIGPVYTSGLYEGRYCRIPWHGVVEPEHVAGGICSECNQPFDQGLAIMAVEGASRLFCSNGHYLRWWRRMHPQGEAPMSGGFEETEA
jgi:hypothetical protein